MLVWNRSWVSNLRGSFWPRLPWTKADTCAFTSFVYLHIPVNTHSHLLATTDLERLLKYTLCAPSISRQIRADIPSYAPVG